MPGSPEVVAGWYLSFFFFYTVQVAGLCCISMDGGLGCADVNVNYFAGLGQSVLSSDSVKLDFISSPSPILLPPVFVFFLNHFFAK